MEIRTETTNNPLRSIQITMTLYTERCAQEKYICLCVDANGAKII
jgi:hypothetical protein